MRGTGEAAQKSIRHRGRETIDALLQLLSEEPVGRVGFTELLSLCGTQRLSDPGPTWSSRHSLRNR